MMNFLRISTVVVIVGVILLITLTSESGEPKPEYTAEQIAAVTDSILAEPRVLDAAITDADVLYAVMQTDGTSRNGFAEYLCQRVKDLGVQIERVKIVEANTQKHPDRDNAYGVLMGEAWCNQ